MSKLVFDAADVRRVVEHSIGSPRQGRLFTGYDAESNPTYSEATAPSVILVHDDGIYLMSNGQPRDIVAGGEDKLGARSFVAHAQGCNPKKDTDWWNRARDLVGGDDFGETLPWARELHTMIVRGAKTITIKITPKEISIEVWGLGARADRLQKR